MKHPARFLVVFGVALTSVLGTFALFFLKGVQMRLVMLGGTALWLVHNYLVGSLGGTVLEAVLCITNLVTIFRMRNTELAQAKPHAKKLRGTGNF